MIKTIFIGEIFSEYLLQINNPFAMAFRKHRAEKVKSNEKGGQYGKN